MSDSIWAKLFDTGGIECTPVISWLLLTFWSFIAFSFLVVVFSVWSGIYVAYQTTWAFCLRPNERRICRWRNCHSIHYNHSNFYHGFYLVDNWFLSDLLSSRTVLLLLNPLRASLHVCLSYLSFYPSKQRQRSVVDLVQLTTSRPSATGILGIFKLLGRCWKRNKRAKIS